MQQQNTQQKLKLMLSFSDNFREQIMNELRICRATSANWKSGRSPISYLAQTKLNERIPIFINSFLKEIGYEST